MTAPALVDLRWLRTYSGSGRVAHHLLAGLHQIDLDLPLTLWGDPDLIGEPPPGTSIAPSTFAGNEWRGQREFGTVPTNERAVYLQQIRPLRGWHSATFIHDTIQLLPGPATHRSIKRRYLRTVARRSRLVITISNHATRCVVDELGADPGRIRRVRLPLDREFARRIAARRSELAPDPGSVPGTDLLYVGRADFHKNHDGLIRAFHRSGLDGSRRLVLFGPSDDERVPLEQLAESLGLGSLVIASDRSDAALIDAYARAGTVVMPSFQEGWGLPVHEAVAAGIPVVSSDAGSLPEVLATAPAEHQHRLVDVGRIGRPDIDALADALAAAPAGLPRHELDTVAAIASAHDPSSPETLAETILDVLRELG